jgi:hypothetical protein
MPQILVITESPGETASTVVYRERISSTDLESTHFSGQLIERVGWAVGDASDLERRDRGAIPFPTRRDGDISDAA